MTRFAALFALIATPAQAHLGHVEGVAGHSHWIGLGALLGAAALAAWLADKGKTAEGSEEEAEAEEAEA